MPVADDLRQIFRILPILSARKTVPIAELMQLGGYAKRAELVRDLERLMMIGVPPYSPADHFDVEITGQDVVLHSDLDFHRPLSLTPTEWHLLRDLIERERQMTTHGALPADEANALLEALGAVPVHFIETGPSADFRRIIEGALEEKRPVAMRYTNVDGPEEKERRLDPWILFEHNRSHYLVARDQDLDESRVFRLDRIHEIRLLPGRRATDPPSDIETLRRPSTEAPRSLRVRFRFPAALLPALQREFRFELEPPVGDKTRMTGAVNVSSLDFFRWYLRAYAPFLEILEPAELRQWIVDEAREFPIPALLSG